MIQQEIDIIDRMLINQVDKIVTLSDKHIVKSTDSEASLEFLLHKLVKLNVKSLSIKKKILNLIRNNK